MAKFELGEVVQTRGIATACEESQDFLLEVHIAFKRYLACDWGDLGEENKALNDSAVTNNDDRILAAYKLSKGKIYIITEWDRSYTTILFADEY
jgi:hypothetical protein